LHMQVVKLHDESCHVRIPSLLLVQVFFLCVCHSLASAKSMFMDFDRISEQISYPQHQSHGGIEESMKIFFGCAW